MFFIDRLKEFVVLHFLAHQMVLKMLWLCWMRPKVIFHLNVKCNCKKKRLTFKHLQREREPSDNWRYIRLLLYNILKTSNTYIHLSFMIG